jgi:hypothetical protein
MQHDLLTEGHTGEVYAAVNFRLRASSRNEADIVRLKTTSSSETHTSLKAVGDIDKEICSASTTLVFSI